MFSGRCWRTAAIAAGVLCCALARAGPPPSSPSEFSLVMEGDRLTARIEGVSLRRVLAELQRQGVVRSEFLGLADDQPVFAVFRDTPLAEALYRLLDGRSFLIYRPAAPAGEAPLAVVILPRAGEGAERTPLAQGIAPAGPSPPADPTATNERSDLAVIAHLGGSLDAFSQAMLDPDEQVRARAQQEFEHALAGAGQSAAESPRPQR